MQKQLLTLFALVICGFIAYLNYHHHCSNSNDSSPTTNTQSVNASNQEIEQIASRKSCKIKMFLNQDYEGEKLE